MVEQWKSEADRPSMEGLQYHIQCRPGDVAPYALLPGDPGRCDAIAAAWDQSRLVASHREYRTFTGTLGDVPISVCSTGIGGPSAAIAVEELASIGVNTFLRVGTCGALQEDIACGDLIIHTAALRQDGASEGYVELGYPASASYDVVSALVEACEDLGLAYHLGLTCSTGSFYCGQARPGLGGFRQSWQESRIEDLRRARVLSFEMEASLIFTLGNLYGLRTGSICVAVANRITDQMVSTGVDRAIAAANRAVTILAERDQILAGAGKKHWYPGLLKSLGEGR